MVTDLDKAQIMFKLTRSKGNWGGKYDRLEHFKRFPNLKQAVKELAKNGWIIVKQKPNYTGISLNNEYKKEIMKFIIKELPYVKKMIN